MASHPTRMPPAAWLAACAIAVFLSGCGKQEQPPAAKAAPAPAPAATPAPDEPGDTRQPSRLTAYLYGKEQIGALYEAGRQWDRKLGLQPDCKTPYNIQPLNLFLLKGIEFPDGQPHPVAGSWQHRFVFERCGKRMTYSAVFVARPGDKPEVREHVPGTTNASMQQVAEALRTAAPAAQARLAKRSKGCKDAELIDTRLTHPPRDPKEADKPAGHWEETWTFRGCGRDVELTVVFTPDGQGGMQYAVK
ncbi:MAG: hypothetical protein FJY34_07535 [Betaproteobacteria bacterium]|nr:hypothetical protein [Betaproteobacteria bacterium]